MRVNWTKLYAVFLIAMFIGLFSIGLASHAADEKDTKNPELQSMQQMLEGLYNGLKADIDGLTDEHVNWRAQEKGGGQTNSIAMLVHHIADTNKRLIGNIIGGKEVDVNHGDAFEVKEAKVKSLLKTIDENRNYCIHVLSNLSDSVLNDEVKWGSRNFNKRKVFLQALIHFGTHRGQISLLKHMQGAGNE